MTKDTPIMAPENLIARLEAATEGSRELDLIVDRWTNTSSLHDDWLDHHPEAATAYTTSLDAALTLLPAHAPGQAVFWRVGNDGEGGNPADFKAEIYVSGIASGRAFNGVAETAPLALCIAALKARATQPKEPHHG